MEGDQTAKLSSLGVLEKTSCGMPLSRTLWPLPTCGHLPNSRGGGREGVYPQNRKVQRIILDPPLHPASSGNPRPHQERRPVLFLGACAKLLSFFSVYRLPFRNLTRWHLEGHLLAKTQTNCDSYDMKSATVNTARSLAISRIKGLLAPVPLVLSHYIVKLLNSACRMMVCITLFGSLESPRAVVNSSVSETNLSVETLCKHTNIVMFILVIQMVTKIFVFVQFVCF